MGERWYLGEGGKGEREGEVGYLLSHTSLPYLSPILIPLSLPFPLCPPPPPLPLPPPPSFAQPLVARYCTKSLGTLPRPTVIIVWGGLAVTPWAGSEGHFREGHGQRGPLERAVSESRFRRPVRRGVIQRGDAAEGSVSEDRFRGPLQRPFQRDAGRDGRSPLRAIKTGQPMQRRPGTRVPPDGQGRSSWSWPLALSLSLLCLSFVLFLLSFCLPLSLSLEGMRPRPALASPRPPGPRGRRAAVGALGLPRGAEGAAGGQRGRLR